VNIWYILTDTTDTGEADGLGLNYAAKLNSANVGSGSRWSTLEADNLLTFDRSSYVDFYPLLQIVPGDAPNYFPPKMANPGSIGNIKYSPITRIQNVGEVYNAPVIVDRMQTEESLNKYCDGLPSNATELAAARMILHDSYYCYGL
jgi:hypothetical protein